MSTNRSIPLAWWLAILERILARWVHIPDAFCDALRAAADRGPLILVLRNRNLVDYLVLRIACRRAGVPPVANVVGLHPAVVAPWWRILTFSWVLIALRGLLLYKRRRFARVLRTGRTQVVFLRRPSVTHPTGSKPLRVDALAWLTSAATPETTRAMVLPVALLWGEHPMKRYRRALTFLFGTEEYPRLLRVLWLLVRHRSAHEILWGTPIDVAALRARLQGAFRAAGALKAQVGKQIETLRRSRLGSFTKPSRRIRAEVVGSKALAAQVAQLVPDPARRAREMARIPRIVARMAADIQPHMLAAFAAFMTFVWRRLYRRIDIPADTITTIKEAVGRGPTLIFPCHKSHVDYLAISETMNAANIMLPHIAAGDNLAFWPLGRIFRSAGAFFIRRTFVNDPVYRAVVTAYVRKLLKEGYAVEVFIEGGRSRTGRLLPPKTGMIEMALDAMSRIADLDPWVVPVFVGYDHVVELESLTREAAGGRKKKENAAALLAAAKVLFHRYGDLYIRAGEPFGAEAFLRASGVSRADLADPSVRRRAARLVADETMRRIAQVTVVPVSAVLAAVLLEGAATKEAAQDAGQELCQLLTACAVPVSDEVRQWAAGDVPDGVALAWRHFARHHLVALRGDAVHIPSPLARIRLDFCKGPLLPHLAAAAVHACARDEADRDAIHAVLTDMVFVAAHDRTAAADQAARHLGAHPAAGRWAAAVLRSTLELAWVAACVEHPPTELHGATRKERFDELVRHGLRAGWLRCPEIGNQVLRTQVLRLMEKWPQNTADVLGRVLEIPAPPH